MSLEVAMHAVYYNVTQRRVRVATVAVKKQHVLHILSFAMFLIRRRVIHLADTALSNTQEPTSRNKQKLTFNTGIIGCNF